MLNARNTLEAQFSFLAGIKGNGGCILFFANWGVVLSLFWSAAMMRAMSGSHLVHALPNT